VHILVVEDDERTVNFLQQSLEEDGHTVDTAFDGNTALAKGRSKPPHDLIVLDIQIPEPNGIEVCTTLRQEGIVAPILILTGRDSPQDVAVGLDAGADDYLVKPFALVELLARVRALTRRQGAPGVKGVLQAGSLELDRLEHPGQFCNFEDQAMSLDRARRLKEAFEKLTPNQKTVVELAYYEGLSQTEMAERLQQPLGTVKTWIRSALKVLREQLTEAAAT